jgi:glycosyltransferase involved in cell wall biosynthesis
MRVLFIAGYDDPAYHRKIELLADAPSVEILHITVAGYGRDPGRYPSANRKRSYTVQTFRAHWLGRQGDPHRSFVWPPDFCMHQFKPHIVHAESDVETIGTAEVALARSVLARQSKLIEYSWQNILRPRNLAVRLLNHWTLRSADHVICASTAAVNVLQQKGYRRSASVMPLAGVDSRYFYPQPVCKLRTELGLEGTVIGYVGRLVPEKGLDVLLLACSQLAGRFTVLIVGDGADKVRLEAMAKSLGLADRCRFVGAVDHSSVAEYMNAMDIFVLPSRTTTHWKEQFGRVLVEAMACKVAVVGSDSGAIPEVVADAGRIFPEGDRTALATILTKLLTDATLLQNTRERGYRRALANFTVERLAERVLTIWRTLAPEPK